MTSLARVGFRGTILSRDCPQFPSSFRTRLCECRRPGCRWEVTRDDLEQRSRRRRVTVGPRPSERSHCSVGHRSLPKLPTSCLQTHGRTEILAWPVRSQPGRMTQGKRKMRFGLFWCMADSESGTAVLRCLSISEGVQCGAFLGKRPAEVGLCCTPFGEPL